MRVDSSMCFSSVGFILDIVIHVVSAYSGSSIWLNLHPESETTSTGEPAYEGRD